MFESIQKIWRSLKRFFRRLFSLAPEAKPARNRTNPAYPLNDLEYEFLFNQLLEGVSRGWHQGRVLKFFDQLEGRSKQRDWISWLNRFGQRVLESSAPNHQLASRMMRLGEIAQSVPSISRIGDLCSEIGRDIFTRDSQGEIWEYQGDDIESLLPGSAEEENISADELEPISIAQLYEILQQNPELVEQMSEQFGVDFEDSDHVIDLLLEQEQQQANAAAGISSHQLEREQLEQAIARWDQELSENPQIPELWYNRGTALSNLYRWDEALASFDRAVNLDPTNYLIWNGLANVYYSTNRIQESFDCWDKVVQIKPDEYQTWCDRGHALELLSRRGEAITSYQKALELKPNLPYALSRLDILQAKPDNLN